MTSYTVTNAGYDQNREDTEMQELTDSVETDIRRKKPFDWCILSVLGYICCPCIGLCAMYYAMRSNHGHDHNIEDWKVRSSSMKAKVLTILSITLGTVLTLSFVIFVVVVVVRAIDVANNMESIHNQSDDWN